MRQINFFLPFPFNFTKGFKMSNLNTSIKVYGIDFLKVTFVIWRLALDSWRFCIVFMFFWSFTIYTLWFIKLFSLNIFNHGSVLLNYKNKIIDWKIAKSSLYSFALHFVAYFVFTRMAGKFSTNLTNNFLKSNSYCWEPSQQQL